MIVWLLTVGEQLPIDAGDSRLMRTGTLSRFLCAAGHDVVWWTSSFNHVRKRQRCACDESVRVNDRLTIKMLHAPGYRRHVSPQRVLNHVLVAQHFARWAPSEPTPDVIVASLPTLELARAATRFGASCGIPVVVDIRDLWPDAFSDLLPRAARLLAAPLFALCRRSARRSCVSANAIIGPAERYVQWGVSHAGRCRTEFDRVFPFAYTASSPAPAAIEEASEAWRQLSVRRGDPGLTVCFFGVLGRQFDLKTVLGAAGILSSENCPVRFVICGTGDHEPLYRDLARGLPNVLFPGWVGATQIWTLMRMSQVGLAPYCSSPIFEDHLPNKPIEYLSAGLPVISSIRGALGALLEVHQCGVCYHSGAPRELAGIFAALQRDPLRLSSMSANAAAVFHREFEAEKVYTEMVHYLEGIAANRGRSERCSI
jgi:glycosyltransferase involved in cell wall biosynthesis